MISKRLLNKADDIAAEKHRLHDRTIDILVERLRSSSTNYDIILPQYKYNLAITGDPGEVDVIAFKLGGYRLRALPFQVKAVHSRRNYLKARKQLKKDYEMFGGDVNKVYSFYVTPNKIRRVQI